MNFEIIPADPMGSWSVVRVTGELDMATADTLRSHLYELLNDGAPDLVVDLAEISFIDSTGLAALVHSFKQAVTKGRSMALLSPAPQAMRVFEASGLLSVLPIYSSAEDLPVNPGGR
ncbi:MAG TPA: STAS domain-containing protein [Actinomycetota bacterium]|nr:STAS domain-containing protein [Actinomycetota bacterium]